MSDNNRERQKGLRGLCEVIDFYSRDFVGWNELGDDGPLGGSDCPDDDDVDSRRVVKMVIDRLDLTTTFLRGVLNRKA